ncbi:MAG: hypothetical protein MK105_05170 [Crocinitomicaceae bacterium]|nr:hypothetical protein [Crocinitomicaceae bacterium]
MTLSKLFLKRFVPLVAVVIIIHISLVFLGFFDGTFKTIVVLDVLLFVVFGAGAILVSPGLDKEPENFVNRFLILTTVQLLAAMSMLAALAYLKMPDMRTVALQFVAVFVVLLALQSFFLVKGVKNSNTNG